MKIKTVGNKGIHITTDNGYTFSIQFGYCNYCENYNGNKENIEKIDEFEYQRLNGTESSNCEVAVFDSNRSWITQEFFGNLEQCDGMVCGYVPLEKALAKVIEVQNRGVYE